MKKGILSLGVALALGLSNSVNAGGLPVISLTELAQMITQYQEQIQQGMDRVSEFEQQYATQIKQWEQQVKSATAPYTNAYSSVKKLQNQILSYQNMIDNLSYNFTDVESYLSDKIGSSSYWEECALSSYCDPSIAISSKYNNLNTSITKSIATASRLQKMLDESLKNASEFENELSSDPGIQAVATTSARMQLQSMKEQEQYNKQMLDYVQQDAEAKMAERKKEDTNHLKGLSFGVPMTFEDDGNHTFTNTFKDVDFDSLSL